MTLRWNVAKSAALSERQRARLLSRLDPRLTRGGDLILHAGRSRSQAHNREIVRERMAELIGDALATRRARVATRASAGARERRLEQKKRRSNLKHRRRTPAEDD